MNRVGIEGRGESVWLGWFLCTVLKSFAEVMEAPRRSGDAPPPGASAQLPLAKSVERSGWDGEWYLRGFFDNGTPLGSHA